MSGNDALISRLPLTVTSITPQKKRADRFSLFHEKEFLMGVSGQTLIDYRIRKGTKLTYDLFWKLEQAEEYQKVKDLMYRYLSRRDHSSFELRQKASKKGYGGEQIDLVLDELDQKGLLSDETFARKFAADKAEFKKWGPVKIQQALRRKGVAADTAEKVTRNLSENLEQVQICVDLLVKRKRHFSRETDPIKRKQKMYRYLSGKGYRGDTVRKAIDSLSDQFDV